MVIFFTIINRLQRFLW